MGIRSQNNPLAAYLDVFSNTGTDAVTPYVAPAGLTATGGVISDYTTGPGDVYRSHIFTSSGALNVTALGDFGDTVEYLVVAGGGGGGPGHWSGGGGAGGYREGRDIGPSYTASPLVAPAGLTLAVQTYPVTVGAGGAGSPGSASVFSTITSAGGGHGVDNLLLQEQN